MSKQTAKLMMMNDEERAIYLANKMDKSKKSNGKFFTVELDKEELKGEPGKDGEDYILTEKDKEEIASKIEVPVVEKVIEKTIVEKPVVKNIIKEVAIVEDAETIAKKINTLEGEISYSVLKDIPKKEKTVTTDDVIKELKKKQYLEPKDIKGMPLNMNDQRWHGGGLSKVSTDGTTVTGDGTPANPLSATAVSENYKNKVSATDTTPDYLVSKVLAGTGISVIKENAGGNEDLKIANTAPDQTVVINAGTNITSVTGTYPNFTINAANQTTSLAGETLDVITTRGATTTNAITVGNVTDSGLTASKVVFTDASKVLTSTGIGTSSQFLKADGSLDSTSYGTGTVTAVSVASANGLAGTSSGGATPTLTLSTSITGVLKGNGTAISACTNLSDVSYLTATGATVGATSQSQVFTNGATLSNMTLGSALFAGTLGVISQDNANYFYDATNYRLGLGTTSPAQKLHIYDGNIRMEQVQFPIAPTVAVNATAGNLNGVYYYTISFVTATGETQVGSRSSSVSPASQQVNLSSIPISASSDVTARKIYRTVANGDVTNMRLVTTIADNTTTTYTDNIADGSLGAYNPQTNTTGALIFNGTNKVFTADQNTTIIGYGALPNNTQVQNLAIGSSALAANTLGSYNTAIGATALLKNTTGYQNLAIGATALVANVSGYDNTAIGYGTLVNNTSYNNLAVGYSALANNTSGHDNIGIGISTVGNNTGNFNTAIGNNAMVSSGNVSSNTVIGGSSGSFLQGSFNTFIGVNSGQFIYDDSYNIAIGNSAQYPGGRTSESIAIGGSSGVYILNTNSSSMAVAVASGGSVTVGTHHYYYTFYFTDGTELQIGGGINATTSAGNQTVNITNIPTYTGSLAIAGRRLYRSLAGGNTFLSYKLADIADNTTTTYTDTLADGSLGARNPGANYSMCSGYQSSYYFSNQAVFGHQGASAITQVYFGGGVESSAPDSFSLMATSATGTNTAGASITLVGGRSTGSANGGNLVFQTAIPGSSGIVPNGTATRMTISGATGAVSVNNLFFPQQAPTVSAPAYVLGAIYYDTTLSKLRVGGATGWETITSL